MNGYKIVICGGGSTYTAGIVKDLIDQKTNWGFVGFGSMTSTRNARTRSLWWLGQLSMTLLPRIPLHVTVDPKKHLQMRTLLWRRCAWAGSRCVSR